MEGKWRWTIFAVAFSLWPASGWTFSAKDGASFLDIPTGGRPAAVGGAYSALATDAYAPIYNPAGLGFLPGPQLAAMHMNSFGLVSYEFASLAIPVATGSSLGAAVQYVRPENTDATDIIGNPIGKFSGSFAAYSLAYGQSVGRTTSFGITGKIIRTKIDAYGAHAFAIDVGGLFRPANNFQVAVAALNIGQKLTYIEQGDDLPLTFRFGAAYSLRSSLTITAQGDYSETTLMSGQAGIEWNVARPVSLRAGYKTQTVQGLNAGSGITAGIGLHLAGQEFDYAWAPMSDLGDSQYLSMVFRWGGQDRGKTASELNDENQKIKYDDKLPSTEDKSLPELDRGGLHP